MAIKTVLATTPTSATISISGDLTFDNFVDIDIDVDTLGRDETASNPEVLINQVDYDINAGSGLGARVERVTEPNPTVVLRIASTAGVGTIENQGQENLAAEGDKNIRVYIEDGSMIITLKKVSGFTQN